MRMVSKRLKPAMSKYPLVIKKIRVVTAKVIEAARRKMTSVGRRESDWGRAKKYFLAAAMIRVASIQANLLVNWIWR